MSARVTLAIETSNPASLEVGLAGEVAIGLAQGDIAVEPVRGGERLGDDLMGAIDRVFRAAGRRPSDLERVAVSIGPGGFTSLRICAATAKMLAEALGVGVVAVESTDVVAASAAPEVGLFGVALASKRGSAWVAFYSRDASGAAVRRLGDEAGVMTADDLQHAHQRAPLEAIFADAHLDPALRDWAARRGVTVAAPTFSAAALLRLSEGRAAVNAATLTPLYPREPEAVSKWRTAGARPRA